VNAVVTGGAGFIGSHLADALLAVGHQVRIVDDLSNGLRANVPAGAELLEGSVADEEVARRAVEGVDVVFHQAALGSVRRSVEAPLATNRANVDGSLSVLEAARRAGVRRVVAASSSSVYGGEAPLPSREDAPPAPKSPYAVTKVALENYARVYATLLDTETVCLRYFNVYGPRQRSDSEYAAAVPLFIAALRAGEPVTIYGDGEQTRDFTFVGDAVAANLLAAEAPASRCSGRTYNVAGGARHSVRTLLQTIADELGVEARAEHAPPRPGDVRDSHADVSAAKRDLGYVPSTPLREGIRLTLAARTSAAGRAG
jgi:nucleoside-diphosphate-sugar epimerase